MKTENSRPKRRCDCRVQLDRIQILARLLTGTLPNFPNFERTSDRFVRPQTSFPTYRRVAAYLNPDSGTEIYLQHECVCPWLWPVKITIVGCDRRGLRRRELEELFSCFFQYQLLTVELALDFSSELELDANFVRLRVLCGKSHLRAKEIHRGEAHFGTRKSEKYVRCYPKPAVNAFRIELELHSAWLKKYDIRTLEDLHGIATVISPAHLHFVRLDWGALKQALSRRGFPAAARELRFRNFDIRRLSRRLATNFGIQNVHRF